MTAYQNCINVLAENTQKLLCGIDVVLDCTDNYETRFLLAQACFNLNIPMSFGSAVRQEGQTAFFQAGKRKNNHKPCYVCIFPENPENIVVSRCSEAGILGPVTGLISSIQSLNVIRYLTNQKVSDNLLLWDGVSFLEIKIKRTGMCPICTNC